MLHIDRTRCTGCALCVDACPTGAISVQERAGVATIDPVLCTECLACVDVCPNGAIQHAKSSELVPAGEGKIVEGQVVERQMIPSPAPGPLIITRQQPGRLATLAGAALALVGNWLLPRAADALISAAEHRLSRGAHPVSPATSLHSGSRLLPRGGRGRQRRRRRRGR